jgi:hypothetical protein
MPKIYDQKQDPDRGAKERSTLSGGAPEKAQNRNTMVIIAIVLAVVLIILFYRMARGDELVGELSFAEPWAVIATALL